MSMLLIGWAPQVGFGAANDKNADLVLGSLAGKKNE